MTGFSLLTVLTQLTAFESLTMEVNVAQFWIIKCIHFVKALTLILLKC